MKYDTEDIKKSIDNGILLLLKNKDENSIKIISSKKECIRVIERNNKPEYLDFIKSIFSS